MNPFSHTAAKYVLIYLLFIASAGLWSCSKKEEQKSILVFSKTAGFRHQSIEAGQEALLKLGAEHNLKVDTTEDASFFNEDSLKNYHTVIFLNTTGDVLDPYQQNSFERYIQAGGGYVGIHAATDTEYDWPWYGKLAGAYFRNHPEIQEATFVVVDKDHPTTRFLPERWKHTDEFYNFKDINPDINTVLTIDENTYKGGANGEFHPMSWYHEYDGGKAFYTGMGHTEESYSDSLFLKHILEGIKYVMGGDNPKPLDYSKARTPKMPEENRFTKVVLGERLDEPMELTVLPDSRVIFVERKGAVKLFKPETGETKLIANIPVTTKYVPKNGKANEAEDGLLGIAHDPAFDKNGWIYLYYSATGEEAKNVLARFALEGDSLVKNSEKIILEVPVQREECCHTGGSIAFDAEGNLYVSTGDNTNPHESNGYSPTDERPGRSAWDAQKSSANTNDLRGKILRIHPEADGTYTIPEGNLFKKGTPDTKPEIYTMGHRNPFRITVDQKTGYVYWGDVGPDANDPTESRGPEGFDEVGQAKGPGNFGWPYFIADNKAYHQYDFAAQVSGEKYNHKKPVNKSPNNTGLQELPPAQSAYIWYPYAESKDFSLVGSGGRTAMAGPVYYKDMFKDAESAFPAYYDGKLFVYEWMRGWIMAVTMDEKGDFASMEPFMPSYEYSNPMDMEFGPEGDLYMLEYGTGWFQANETARLVKVTYNGGNRKPLVAVSADKTAGALPFTVQLSADGTIDHDHDKLKYEWKVATEGGKGQTFSDLHPTVTLAKAGVYKATLTVEDENGEKASRTIELLAGNEPPTLNFDILDGNSTFFFPGKTIAYEVKVTDKEDGNLENGISASSVAVNIDYLPEGYDQNMIAMGHKGADEFAQVTKGQRLIDGSDCKACHDIEKKSIGPSYKNVALKYKNDENASAYLAKKVISGGSGVWGEVAMSAHPQLEMEDAREMADYILSLSDEKEASSSLPVKGTYTTAISKDDKGVGTFILRAAYKDNGANGVPGLTSEKIYVLRNPNVQATQADVLNEIQKFDVPDGPEIAIASESGSYLGLKKVDLKDIAQITCVVSAPKEFINSAGGMIEVRLGSPEGEIIGRSSQISPTTTPAMSTPPQMLNISIDKSEKVEDLYFLFVNEDAAAGQSLFIITNIIFNAGTSEMAENSVSIKN